MWITVAAPVLAGTPLDDRDVDPGQRQLAGQHQPGRISAGDHQRMPGRGRVAELVRMTSCWVARVIAT